MSEPDHRKKVDEIAEVICTIGSEWEVSFIDDMQTWEGDYTPKQVEVIDQLYEKACSRPY